MIIEVSATINAPHADILHILRDYKGGHVEILPPQFQSLEVEAGGYGAGTVYRLTVKVMGQTTIYHHEVTEPEAGRILKESDRNTPQWSAYHLEPIDANTTQVTIKALMVGKSWLERRITAMVSRRLFKQILENLERVAVSNEQ